MREIEFLPPWYGQTRRRRRLVIVQVWLTIVVAVALTVWVVLAQRNLSRNQFMLVDLQTQLSQSRVQLHQMDDLTKQRQQLLNQKMILAKLGLQVEPSRILRQLEALMPPQMALLNVTIDADEHGDANGPQAALVPAGELPVDRHLRIRVHGVAPTDLEMTNFTSQLSAVPFFEDVAIVYAKERSENGRVLREFEVTFSITLNMPARS